VHRFEPMPKKSNINHLGGTLAESVWLAALIVIPICTDLQASQIFSAPKTAMLEIFGILSAIAIALSALESRSGGQHFRAVRTALFPLSAAAVLLAVALVSWRWSVDPTRAGDIETAASMSPRHLACQISLFLSVSLYLRTWLQLKRMALAAMAAGFTVAAFALLQAYGLHAPGYSVMEGMEITSFIGGPIFLAGYLLMLVPLAVWNLHRQLDKSNNQLSAAVVVAAVVLLVLLGAFLACEKRGPLLGLLAAGGTSLVLLGMIRRRRKALLAAAAFIVVAAASLTSLAVLLRANAQVNEIPFIEKLAKIVPVGGETGDSYRSNLWRLLPDFIFGNEPLVFPSGSSDPYSRLRPWLGYGPDSVQAVLASKYLFLQAWPGSVLEMSCHSHFWDLLLNLGLAGVAAFFALFFGVWYQGMAKIGLGPSPPLHLALALTVGISLVGGATTSAIFHAGFFGIGAQTGFLAGLLCLGLWRNTNTGPTPHQTSAEQLLLLAMLSGLAGHWIDLGFIFPTDENSTLFWIFAGAVVGVRDCAVSNRERAGERDAAVWASAVGSAVVISAIRARADLPSLLGGKAGLQDLFGSGPAPLLLGALVILSIWAGCRLFFPPENGQTRVPEACCLRVLAMGLIYMAGVLCLAQAMSWFPPNPQRPFLADLWAVHYPVILIAGIVWMALHASPGWQRIPLATLGACLLPLLLTVAIVWLGPLRDLRSSVSAGFIKSLPAARLWLERGISLRPGQIRNYSLLGRLLMAEGFRRDIDPEVRQELLQASKSALTQGMAISRLNLLSANLGRLYLWQAMQEESNQERTLLAELAKEALLEATRFAPQNEPAWFDAALVEENLFGRVDSATLMRRKADDATLRAEVWQNIVEENWGSYYILLAANAEPKKLRRAYAHRALLYLQIHLANTGETLMQMERTKENDKTRERILHDRVRSLAYASEAMRILGRESEAASLYTEGEDLCQQINQHGSMHGEMEQPLPEAVSD
jgi:hypothetical protein